MKFCYFRKVRLDEIDALLVRALFENARCSMTELSASAGLSVPSVIERVKRLEEAGVLTGYRAQINPAALGLEVSAYIRIRPIPGYLQRVQELLGSLPEVVECHRITGEDCFIAKVLVPSVRAIQGIVDRLVPCASTNTSIVQSTPISRRLPAISSVKRSSKRNRAAKPAEAKGKRADE